MNYNGTGDDGSWAEEGFNSLSPLLSHPGQYDGPGGESFESIFLRPSDAANCVDRYPIQQPAPRSHGDPQCIYGNYGPAMTSNLDHYPQYSLNITAPGHFSAAEPLCQPLNGKACPEKLSMVELSARKDKSFTFHESYDEGSSKGKQPQHNGKDHEVARSGRRPGPGILHTVRKTCAKPPRRTPRKSAPSGGKKQCVYIDADKTAGGRNPNWTAMQTLILLLKKMEFSETPGESWSKRASEFFKSQGFDRTPVHCQQRWDTMKKHYDKSLQVDPSRIDEGNIPAGFFGQSLLYDLMRMIMGGHGEQQSPSKDTQSSEQLEPGALAQSSAILTDPIDFSNAYGPSLRPDVPTFLSDDAYASGQKTNSSSYASLYASVGRLWQEVDRLSQDVKTMKDRDAEILVGSYLDLTNDGSFPVE